MWCSEVDTKVWMSGRSANIRASQAQSISLRSVRDRAQMIGPLTFLAMAFTASKSEGLETGNPASMASTSRRASCSAISTFSLWLRLMPGACSPSRSVVSKMYILCVIAPSFPLRSAPPRRPLP